jgi:hypothetical protein
VDFANTTRALMTRHRLRSEAYLRARTYQGLAELYVLKPYRPIGFRQTANCYKRIAAEAKKGAGGLVDLLIPVKWQVQAAVAAVDRIARKQAVDAEHFQDQRGGRWKTAKNEATLGLAVVVEQKPPGGAVVRGVHEMIEATLYGAIRVQEQNEVRIQLADPEIGAAGEAQIFRRSDPSHAVILRGSLSCPVLGGVIDDDDGAVEMAKQRVDACGNLVGGIPGHDHGAQVHNVSAQ